MKCAWSIFMSRREIEPFGVAMTNRAALWGRGRASREF